jgi:hypothetical protein
MQRLMQVLILKTLLEILNKLMHLKTQFDLVEQFVENSYFQE